MHSSTSALDDAAPGLPTARPVAIEVRGVEKTFRIPEHRIDTFKERASHPFAAPDYRLLRPLRGVSFDIHRGEFFGIAGLNGSGKSTLLKILASIYKPDAGRVRMAGRLAPFIELGVGFDPELTARENSELNGVLMGLSRREARSRLDAVLDFAELRDFAELKLKNYSSGMMVRLAFAVMVQADADIMLVDEVLAVGDAAFAQRCMDVFHEKRRQGKTIVLVTHDMPMIQSICHRAMLLADGEIAYIGDPDETARRYHRLNFAALHQGLRESPVETSAAVPDINARVVEARLTDEAGNQVDRVQEGSPIRIEVVLEAKRELVSPTFVLQAMNEPGVVVFSVTRTLENGADRVAEGDQVRLAGRVENRLVPGRYAADCWVRRQEGDGLAVHGIRLLEFVVEGAEQRDGVVSVDAELAAVTVRPEDP